MKLPSSIAINNLLADAVSTNDIPTLHSLLDDQDRQLLSQIAQNGTPETAAYLLSRYPIPKDFSQDSPSNRILNPTQYLACESARLGNTAVFRYLNNQYPSLLSTHNRCVESILVNAIDGGVGIWKIILEHHPSWKNHEFSGHKGCVLEFALELRNKDVLEFLLREGADTDRAGDPLLELARRRGAESEILELIKKYSV
ncbi:hypothetical protein N7G274_001828 [Stereocaulon virgatum]|uniref:Ankyrin repeat protein n=1 Tax=Stereocaulon virgatum TaxID=373712 RepID=A0ABR4ANK9_9LECA